MSLSDQVNSPVASVRPAPTRHVMIFASAGSGKTHALVRRFIRLLADESARARPGPPPPARLIALTFTRKAAAQFFDEIVRCLAKAARSPADAQKLGGDIDRPGFSPAEAARILRSFIDAMPHLALGTLDGFFARVLRAFPFEFGLSGDFQLISDDLAHAERRRVFQHVFHANDDPTPAQREFLQAFQLATFGSEERSLLDALDRFVTELHSLWLGAPEPHAWGHEETIWPRGQPFLEGAGDPEVIIQAREDLIDRLSDAGANTAQLEAWEDMLALMFDREEGAPFDTKLDKFLREKILVNREGLRAGAAEFPMGRKLMRFGKAECLAIRRVIGLLVGRELLTQLRRTAGLWAVLHHYERAYDEMVRGHGRLSFDDILLVMAGRTFSRRLGGREAVRIRNEHIFYRLDAKHDHWLIDEFQDTSLLQWTLIEPLVSEVLACDDGSRTYFQVGDEKQAIYGWRGGESRLARALCDELNRDGVKRLVEQPLNVSHRSGPEVIDFVNAVFGALSGTGSLFPRGAVERWHWDLHRPFATDRAGCAVVMRPSDDESIPGEDRERAVVAGLISEMDPVSRGLSCAVLLRSNDEVIEMAEFIRAHTSQRVAVESEAPVATDNPVTLALLALIEFAAHPGNRFARGHVAMTPLEAVIHSRALDDKRLVWRVLSQVHSSGFEGMLRDWTGALDEAMPTLDDFSRLRMQRFIELAREFDSSGSRDFDAFIDYARHATHREPGDPALAINVMTIHKAKGLGFDVVITAGLDGRDFGGAREPMLVGRPDATASDGWRSLGAISWLLRSPRKVILELVPELKAALDAVEVARCYESFCTFYVAATRAKRALYLVAPRMPDPARRTRTAAGWLDAVFGDRSDGTALIEGQPVALGASFGKWDWFDEIKPAKAAKAPKPQPPIPPSEPPPFMDRRLRRRTPSREEAFPVDSAQLFSTGATGARDRGVLIHSTFEQVGDPADFTPVLEWWNTHVKQPEDWQSAALDEVRACLAKPDIRDALGRPGPATTVWRERSFDVVVDGAWVTGTFDRVVIENDRARIIDFKTDAVDDEAAIRQKADVYRPQLALYRQALGLLTGIPATHISAVLVFTKSARVCEVTPEGPKM